MNIIDSFHSKAYLDSILSPKSQLLKQVFNNILNVETHAWSVEPFDWQL